jgi:hypothetical protein
MTYICAGMYRSGSTWLYNAVRLILKNAGVSGLAAGWIADKDRLLLGENVVIKAHTFDHTLVSSRTVVLTSYRDLRDVAASICRKSKRPFAMARLRETVESHARWFRIAAFDLRYENLLIDKRSELQKIVHALRLPGDTVRRLSLDLILQQIESEKFCEERATPAGHDAVNLLHKGHITDGRHGSWTTALSNEVINSIEEEFCVWLTKRGYLTSRKSSITTTDGSKSGGLNQTGSSFSLYTRLIERMGWSAHDKRGG